MINRYLDQILNVFNYVDSLLLTDVKGMVLYYKNFRNDLNDRVKLDP